MKYIYKLTRLVRHYTHNLIRFFVNIWRNPHFYHEKKFPEFYTKPDAGIYIVSFPKSGRTWLRAMLGKYLIELKGIAKENFLEIYALTRELPDIPVIAFVHDGSSYGERNLKARELETRKHRYQNMKIVLLVRDPRDTLVSYYFQCTRRRRIYKGDISSFIRNERFGIQKIIHFLNIWARNRNIPQDFLLLRYEDIYRNPSGELDRVLKFMGIPVRHDLVRTAVNFAQFTNMQAMEKNQQIESRRLTPGNKKDPESYKVRKGQLGGYVDYLSMDDISYLTDMIKTELWPCFGYGHQDGYTL